MTSSGSKLPLGRYGAVMEKNVGAGFENAIEADDTSALCETFISIFGVDAGESSEWLALGDVDLGRYTVYRPANWVAGEKYPIVTWGDGTCMQPETYGALLRYIASQGFFVVAANSRFVGSGAAQLRALDFAFAANEDASSPYYHRLDTTKVAAAGHSQGALSTRIAAADSRVKTAILFNGSSDGTSKPFLVMSADHDVGVPSANALAVIVNAAPKAAYLYYHMISSVGPSDGYLLLIQEPQRLTGASADWLQYQLNGDAQSKRSFVGASCGLCGHAAQYEYGQHGLN